MLALKIIGGILLLLFLLLLGSVRIHFSYLGGEMKVSAHYLFFRFQLWPLDLTEKPEKKKRPKKAAKKAQKEPEEPPKKKKTPLEEKLESLRGLLRAAKKSVRLLCRHFVIYKVNADIAVSRSDAHQTALAYAKTASFWAVLLEILDWAFVLKKPKVRISPDFTKEKSVYNLSFRMRIRPLFALIAGVGMLFAFLKMSPKKTKEKGGQHYESATSNR